MFLDLNDGEQPSSSEQAVICEDPAVWNSKITELFLVGEMPKEFFDFWFFCKKLCPSHPQGLIISTYFLILILFHWFKLLAIIMYLSRCFFVCGIKISWTL